MIEAMAGANAGLIFDQLRSGGAELIEGQNFVRVALRIRP
jgi:hypothetical protein